MNDRPEDEVLVKMIEDVAAHAFRRMDDGDYFSFYHFDRTLERIEISRTGTVKSQIARSQARYPIPWNEAEAVVLSYCGKRVNRYNVGIRGTSQAYCLEVNLKTGAMSWEASDTRTAKQLKEALEVARR